MGRTARPVLVGLLGVLAVLVLVGWVVAVAGRSDASATSRTDVVSGMVEADGAAVLPAGWSVTHPAPGYYVVRSPGGADALEVETWDAAAEVSTGPIGDGAVEIRFVGGGQPVDSRFTWRSLVER
jgi:hypothetical protein